MLEWATIVDEGEAVEGKPYRLRYKDLRFTY